MKNLLKLSTLAAVLTIGTAVASADLIGSSSSTVNFYGSQTFATVAAETTAGFPTVASFGSSGSAAANLINTSPTWGGPLAGSSWVGGAASYGPNAATEVNPAFGYYLYGYHFTSATTITNLDVLADDTVDVFLNGTNVITPGMLGADTHCAANAPSCLLTLEGVFNGPLSVAAGSNLWFIVEQAGAGPAGQANGGDPSGLDFTFSTPVPEPSTLLMLGTGLIGSAGALFRRMRKS